MWKMFLQKRFLCITALVLLVIMGQASAGPNAGETLSLDLISNGGVGNQREDSVTTAKGQESSISQASVCPGDFDDSGEVNTSDFLLFIDVFGTLSGDANYNARMDIDGNGVIGIPDFLLFADVFGTTCTRTPSVDREALVAFYNATNGANWRNKTNWLSDRPLNQWHGVTTDADGRVTELDLNTNQLTGTIPSQLRNLSNLEVLHLGTNQLTGTIPSQLRNLSNLEVLHLGTNQLTGTIPSQLRNLSNLKQLWLHSNQLTGTIPSQLHNLSNLEVLHLGTNQLTGTIPSQLRNLSNLKQLWLHSNQLTGTIPSQLHNLSKLQSLYIDNNPLSGALPSTFTSLRNLENLWLHNTQLCVRADAAFQAWLRGIANKKGVIYC